MESHWSQKDHSVSIQNTYSIRNNLVLGSIGYFWIIFHLSTMIVADIAWFSAKHRISKNR